jgi:hypothetical protein
MVPVAPVTAGITIGIIIIIIIIIIGDFTQFSVSSRTFLSLRYATSANLIGSDIDIFKKQIKSLKQTLR